ncbi:MFS transporter [Pseudonocardia spinosispora]|uniref:MFS transporter n=1 Tax=Pseudonocardia spinosispora TaxID=103441 RepID=UPI00040E08B4|nr:MFS transporter [Pseudonocardia spinosispora]
MTEKRVPTLLLATAHGSVDLYQGVVPVLVPFLVAQRHYDYVAVSGFVLAASVLSSVVQPLFGLLTDRHRMRWLIPVSMLITGIGVALIGVVDSYPATLAVIAVSGVGVAGFHPEAARLARSVTGGGHVGMSWFSLGGNVGFALAPVIATPILIAGGLGAAPFLAIPALIGTALVLPMLRRDTSKPSARASRDGIDDWKAFGTLSAIIVLRSVAYVGLSTFLGLFVQQRMPHGAAASGLALFVLYAAGAVGTVLGGRCAVRWGRLRTLRVAYLASAFALAGVAFAPGPSVLVFVAAASLGLYVPFSLHITLGQDYLPTRMGTASGVTLGLAASVGGAFAPALGAIAEATSLQVTLACLIVLPVIAWWLGRTLRDPATRTEALSAPSVGSDAAGDGSVRS